VSQSSQVGAVARRALSDRDAAAVAPAPPPEVSPGWLSPAMAHELRNPLSAMTQAIRLVHESADVPDEDRELLELVMAEGSRLDRMVQRAARGAAAGAGPEPADLAALLEATVALVRLDPGIGQGVAFHVRTDPALAALAVDRDAVSQVLWNLLLNAARAVGDRGHVTVSARLDGGAGGDRRPRLVLEVCDDGPGLPAMLRGRLAEPGVTTRPGGAGLGLAVVQGIARSCGGELSLADSQAGGACVRLWLPLDPSADGKE